MKSTVKTAIAGATLGFVLQRTGFASWDEVHRMFLFTDLRLFLTFASGVSLLAIAWQVIARVTTLRPYIRPLSPGVIPGAALFGLGWALCGTCPGITLVQLGEGNLWGLVTLAGIVAGNAIYPAVHSQWFRWPVTSSCLGPV